MKKSEKIYDPSDSFPCLLGGGIVVLVVCLILVYAAYWVTEAIKLVFASIG